MGQEGGMGRGSVGVVLDVEGRAVEGSAVVSRDLEDAERAYALYQQSFPASERLPEVTERLKIIRQQRSSAL